MEALERQADLMVLLETVADLAEEARLLHSLEIIIQAARRLLQGKEMPEEPQFRQVEHRQAAAVELEVLALLQHITSTGEVAMAGPVDHI